MSSLGMGLRGVGTKSDCQASWQARGEEAGEVSPSLSVEALASPCFQKGSLALGCARCPWVSPLTSSLVDIQSSVTEGTGGLLATWCLGKDLGV